MIDREREREIDSKKEQEKMWGEGALHFYKKYKCGDILGLGIFGNTLQAKMRRY
jgi:hypothetical protein